MNPALAGLALILLVAPPGEPAGEPPVLQATTGASSTEWGAVSLNVGRNDGAAIDDPFWIFVGSTATAPEQPGTLPPGPPLPRGVLYTDPAQPGTLPRVLAHGDIYFLTDDRSAGRSSAPAEDLPAGLPAAVLRLSALHRLVDRLPADVTVRGRITRVPPSYTTAWLDVGRRAGLRIGDGILIRRLIQGASIPLARGRIEILEDALSLTTLSPLVGNALPQSEDVAELWPAPARRRWGSVNSAVLAVAPAPEGAILTIVGTAADGLAEGRLVDLYRSGGYVGAAAITKVSDPLSVAQLIESASAEDPMVGDDAIVRGPPAPPAGPLSAAVFRIEGDYCLIAAGESDGVQRGDPFIVRRQDPQDPTASRTIAELIIRTVKMVDAGADVRYLGADAPRLARWDVAERSAGGSPLVRSHMIGMVERAHAGSSSAVAVIDPDAPAAEGTVIRWIPAPPAPPGGAIVLRRTGTEAVVYVPPGWGDPRHLPGARVELTLTAGDPPPVTRRRAPDAPHPDP